MKDAERIERYFERELGKAESALYPPEETGPSGPSPVADAVRPKFPLKTSANAMPIETGNRISLGGGCYRRTPVRYG